MAEHVVVMYSKKHGLRAWEIFPKDIEDMINWFMSRGGNANPSDFNIKEENFISMHPMPKNATQETGPDPRIPKKKGGEL